jgi:diguanylate cyclase (GGDEF)-like protein
MLECDALQYLFFAFSILFLVSIYFNFKQHKSLEDRQEHESALIKRAYYNPLTGLPNQQNLDIMIEEQIHRAKRHKKTFVLAVIKVLNYHDVILRSKAIGQEFIIEAGTRLVESVRDEDIVAHTTENGFVILCNEYLKEDNSNIIFERIENVFKEPLEINPKTMLHYKISIGKAIYPSTGETADLLIHTATREALRNP